MKSKTITAMIIAAALVIFSAVLFFNKKQTIQTAFSITGNWKLDSMYAMPAPADSSWHLPNSIFGNPGNKPLVAFNPDSTISNSSAQDTTLRKYYLKDSTLYVDAGKGYVSYLIKTKTDSLFEFVTSDSMVYVLMKK
jgi:hypothetical protein